MRPNRRRGPARIGVWAATLVTTVVGAGIAGPAPRAAAAAPVRTGWWNTAPAGFFPAQTSSGQLAVSEGAAGPMAVSALAYPAGGAPSSGAVLTLSIDGNSSFGPIQVRACPVKETSVGWKAGGSQTGSPPAYDCSRSVAGQVASSGSAVAFTLGSGQAEPDGSFNVVVLPASGALPFQMVANPPGTTSLAAKPASPGAGAPAPAPAGGSQTSPAPSGSPGGASSPAPDASGGSTAPSDQGVTLSPTDSGTGIAAQPAPAAPAPSTASSAQAAPAPGSPPAASGASSASSLPPPPGTGTAGRSSPTGKILGFGALLIVLVLYSEGFGVLGGRIRPLSSRYVRRQPAAGADSLSA